AQVVGLDDAVEVDVDEVEARHRAPVAQQPGLHVPALERFLEQRVVEQVDLADGKVVRGPPVGVELLQLVLGERAVRGLLACGERHCVLLCAVPAAAAAEMPSSAPACRAIISSSLVGITHAETRLPAREIRCPRHSLAASSSVSPSQAQASQMRRRITVECSPIPAVKTSASTPPRTAASAPTCFAAWYTK